MANGNGYSMGRMNADGNGHYQLNNVPNGRVVLQGMGNGGNQPCAAIATVNGANAVTNIELVASGGVRATTTSDASTLSGVVYRTTPAGRQPLPGVLVEYEASMDLLTATTVTDQQGRYALCRLPSSGFSSDVYFMLNGVMIDRLVTISGDQVLDMEMTP
jgi:hypothetical protein